MQKRKCQICIQRSRLGHLAEIHGLCLRENDNMLPQLAINSVSHSLPAKRSARFLKWLFYAHYIYFLSTYFPLHPWNLLFCFQQCTKFVLIKVTNDFIIATLGDPSVSILQDSFGVLNTLSLQPFNLAFYDTVLTVSYLGFFLLSDNSYLFFLVFFSRNVCA